MRQLINRLSEEVCSLNYKLASEGELDVQRPYVGKCRSDQERTREISYGKGCNQETANANEQKESRIDERDSKSVKESCV